MAKKKGKMEPVEDLQDALTLLGHQSAELPPDADVSSLTFQLNKSNSAGEDSSSLPPPVAEGLPSEKEEKQKTSGVTVPLESEVKEPETEKEEVEEEEELTPDERIRRWQSTADKFRTEGDNVKKENELLKQQLQQTANTLQMMQDWVRKYGMQDAGKSVETEILKPKIESVSPPRLEDFIKDDDTGDILESHTKVGRGFQEYLIARDKYLVQMTKQETLQEVEKRTESAKRKDEENKLNETVRRRAQKLAEKHPEFENVLKKGEPDYKKIEEWIVSLSQGMDDNEWIWLKEFQDFKAGKVPTADDTMKQIEKIASKSTSVSAISGVSTKPKPVPKEIAELTEVFGRLELPPE